MNKVEGKTILYGDKARQRVLEGINCIADAIKMTLGPRGKTILIEKEHGYPHLTKDGVTVARHVRLGDSSRNMGVEMIRNVAAQTCHRAGDGTTTATVLAQEMATEGLKLITAGISSNELRHGMDYARDYIVNHIEINSKEVNTREDLKHVAFIASNGDEAISEIIADAFDKVGREGVVTIEDGSTTKLELDFKEGMQFDGGFTTPLFVNNIDNQTCEYSDVYVMVHEKPILNPVPYLNILNAVHTRGKPLLIVAENVEATASATLGINVHKNGLKSCAVKSPGSGERRIIFSQDIAAFTGAKVINQDLGRLPENIKIDWLGQAEKIIVSSDKTIIIAGGLDKDKKEKLDGVIHNLRKDLADPDFTGDVEFTKLRVGMLTGGIACIKVGGASMLELRERKDRVEDAYFATQAAFKGGVVPGGGIALLRAGQALEKVISEWPDEDFSFAYRQGVKIAIKATKKPLWQIITNAGHEQVSLLMDQVESYDTCSIGYDARQNVVCDMFAHHIIDPTNVVKAAFEDATSAAGALISLEAMVLYDETKREFS